MAIQSSLTDDLIRVPTILLMARLIFSVYPIFPYLVLRSVLSGRCYLQFAYLIILGACLSHVVHNVSFCPHTSEQDTSSEE